MDDVMQVLGWVFVGLVALSLLVGVVMFVAQLPEVRRYLKIRAM
jgi:hypothetical protein